MATAIDVRSETGTTRPKQPLVKKLRLMLRHRFTGNRMKAFVDHFRLNGTEKIIDVGGTDYVWRFIAFRGEVWLVNLGARNANVDNFHVRNGDGRKLAYANDQFDIAFSNSVIEHVGQVADMEAFAREVRRVSQKYWVQTPNKWFPVEPHFMCAFIHWLPRPIFRKLIRWFSLWGLMARPSRETVDGYLARVLLLDEPLMRRLFPDAEIHKERVLGLTKSLIAVKG